VRYLSESDIAALSPKWADLVGEVRRAVATMAAGDFAQPLKPYLRYRNPVNRIIAMPAFLGGDVGMAGLKWIASFPGNLARGLPRAHALTILNEGATGRPLAVIDASSLSAIRTAAVSGVMITEFLRQRADLNRLTVGICGFGPIAQRHLQMLRGIVDTALAEVVVFEVDPSRRVVPPGDGARVRFCDDWREAYDGAHLFITCTTSRERYINRPPTPGSLHLNVSLRDYAPKVGRSFSRIVVDDWEEVCRENTDIQLMHDETGLGREQTLDLAAVCTRGGLDGLGRSESVMFNPMGMAVFDVAVTALYYRAAIAQQIGTVLPGGAGMRTTKDKEGAG